MPSYILDIFKNTAHRLDIQTAVEIGELVPVRCIRIHTNIDLTKVRFNSVQYNIRDLESKICKCCGTQKHSASLKLNRLSGSI